MKDGLRDCSRECMREKQACKDSGCRMWVDFPEEYNCCLISIYENGSMTLREIGERLKISFARVKQIESKAIAKIRRWEGISQ